GVLRENVMSGRVASMPLTTVGSGCPPLATTKCAAAPAPTRRETKMRLCAPDDACHTTHGTVGLPAVIVPAATRGSSASAAGSAFRVHVCSAASFAEHVE